MALLEMIRGVEAVGMLRVLSENHPEVPQRSDEYAVSFDGSVVEDGRHNHVLRDDNPRKVSFHRSVPYGNDIGHKPGGHGGMISALRNVEPDWKRTLSSDSYVPNT